MFPGRLSIWARNSGLTIAFRNRSIAERSSSPGPLQCSMDAARLWPGEGKRQRAALGGWIEFALAPVARPLDLDDVAGVDQLLEHAGQTLLGDFQNVEKFGDGQTGHAVDEMKDAVMRAAEAVFGQDLVRIRREIAIGEEKELDDRQIDAVVAGDGGLDRFGGGAFCHHDSRWFPKLCQYY